MDEQKTTPTPEPQDQPDAPGRSDEAHDKPQGEGLGAPPKADTLPTDDADDDDDEAEPKA